MISRTLALSTIAAIASLGACASSQAEPVTSSSDMQMPAFTSMSTSADVLNAEGEPAGTLTATSAPGGVILRVALEPGTLTPGWHGLHLHQNSDCSDTGVFKLSGGHVGKVEGGHGLLNPAGPEGGDLSNIHAAMDGSASAEMFSPRIELASLMAGGGFAMIIHEGPDDHITQPIGGAGGRVACAAVKS